MDVTCPKCGATNRNTSHFCARCGEVLPQAPQEGGKSIDLPWLQEVHERAVRQTGELSPARLAESEAIFAQEQLRRQAAKEAEGAQGAQGAPEQPKPEENTFASPAPVAPMQEGNSGEPNPPAGQTPPADEPPPGWVVSILEPDNTPEPGSEQTYEPEELAHIMPWLGESKDAPPGEGILPPWLGGMTVQETLQNSPATEQPNPPSAVSDLDLEGLQPFVPPELQASPKEAKAEPAQAGANKLPDWVKSFDPEGANKAEADADFVPVRAELTDALLTGGLNREIAVRPPRPGAVETLATLIGNPGESVALLTAPLPVDAAPKSVAPTAERRGFTGWLFPDGIIYIAILAVLISVLALRPPLGQLNAPHAADVLEFYNAVDAAPRDKPVLLVFDWDASRYAEMSTLSDAVTRHLMLRHIKFVTVSTVAQGPGFAEQITSDAAGDGRANYGYRYGTDYLVMGYLPGNEAALRSLSGNFSGVLPLDYLNSAKIESFPIGSKLGSLNSFSMVIDLASDEAGLRGWIEQVASRSSLPMLAAVPRALEPLARPYRGVRGAGLAAVISGQEGAMQYIEQLQSHGQGAQIYNRAAVADTLNAQSVAQLLVALAIIGAFVSLGTRSIFRRG